MKSQELTVIVGLGVTAAAVARYLKKLGRPFALVDTRPNPPMLAELKSLYPEARIHTGGLSTELFAEASTLVVSPGLSIKHPDIAEVAMRGIPVIGDIELFAQAVRQPIAAITGTNAKSTVTTVVGLMAELAGFRVKVGGNLGVPALDLMDPHADMYVLELSSFQLETTYSLAPVVATILNVTPDHMDRYDTLADYQAAKQRVYHQAKVAVYNVDDAQTVPLNPVPPIKYGFTLGVPKEGEFGVLSLQGEMHLAYGNQPLLATKDLPIRGRLHQANALASLAMGMGLGLPMEAMLTALKTFKGLPHRCQYVREREGVVWYNDSKGTNVGASLAAIEGLGPEIPGKLVLIAGGLGKNADFAPLLPALKQYAREVILIGEAAPVLQALIGAHVPTHRCQSLEEAVNVAAKVSLAGDSVLLSPACASWDMFKNFEHRGDVFTAAVKGLS